jgi:hypothetical protein
MPKPRLVHEVISEVQKQKSKADKIKVLREYDTAALCDYLRGTFDDTIQWNLPAGKPPYQPCEPHNAPSTFLRKNVDLRYFVKGGPGDKLPAVKRESIFISLIESIDPEDALLVISMINKETPKYITRNIVEEAFPNLLQDKK